jgi:uncharacterized protein YjiS (DUF1127 family)
MALPGSPEGGRRDCERRFSDEFGSLPGACLGHAAKVEKQRLTWRTEMRVPLVSAGAVGLVADPPGSIAWWPQAIRLLARGVRRMRARQVRRIGLAKLAGLPDHLLRDMGISRSELRYERRPSLPDAFTVYGSDSYTRVWGDGPRR